MDKTLFEKLLYEEEGTSLDFKRDQYLFSGATNEDKSELLKDILAFANSWRRQTAHILIGVKEVKGGKSLVFGVADHLDDASLQQFVNKKIQRPISFSYIPFKFDGKEVGIIEIPLQQRPFYLSKTFGKLDSDLVYIRRGSSTDIAKPDEVAKMGESPVEISEPSIDLNFVDLKDRKILGKKIKITSQIIKFDKNEIPYLWYFGCSIKNSFQ